MGFTGREWLEAAAGAVLIVAIGWFLLVIVILTFQP